MSGYSELVAEPTVAMQKARNDNEMAYHDLVLANPDKVAFNIIDNATTTDFPDGDAALAWKRLSGKYKSKSATNVVDLVQNSVNLG